MLKLKNKGEEGDLGGEKLIIRNAVFWRIKTRLDRVDWPHI
jgi:hypothetical protein